MAFSGFILFDALEHNNFEGTVTVLTF